jgi:hypothetical protein
MGVNLKQLITELETKVKDAVEDVDGEVRKDLATVKTEVAALESDVKGALAELETQIPELVATYGPELKALETALVSAVEDAFEAVLSHFES